MSKIAEKKEAFKIIPFWIEYILVCSPFKYSWKIFPPSISIIPFIFGIISKIITHTVYFEQMFAIVHAQNKEVMEKIKYNLIGWTKSSVCWLLYVIRSNTGHRVSPGFLYQWKKNQYLHKLCGNGISCGVVFHKKVCLLKGVVHNAYIVQVFTFLFIYACLATFTLRYAFGSCVFRWRMV